ncbi:class I SAM-dependent methyltransferase [Ectothiorhodospira sp. 9100]|uniref:class I SAM-dependent methyltransferase n=1 Tax=unclassified Ectothiorhodospira TaxID=2684909 RepID=UPI001EE8F798|nr:class I SAM-dependent methyltransferase [Ectothiorhodospira sp. 9100]MCG5518060.1 class I SAM-dependent methyltransferase [Ectothiorhodospira sp. 9905]
MRGVIYDRLILKLTSRWYAEVLERMPDGAVLLDVGIGTAGALMANAGRLRDKALHVVGIDIDADYVDRARQRLRGSSVEDRVQVRLESVHEHRGGPYDAVYFSASFMLLPHPEQVLRRCCDLLNPGGRIFFTQTIQERRSRWMETFKPWLRRLTSIDFGRVTYREDLEAQIRGAGLAVETFTVLSRHGHRASCLIIARPTARSEPAARESHA